MTKISVQFDKIKGNIKPMHAVGQPPFLGALRGIDFSPMDYLRDANIPFARLHDVWGAFGSDRFVDIPNLFRDFDADETDPENYDFTFTDLLMEAMHEKGVSPIFRLGVTIENQMFIKAYRIFPPKDFEKWARICEHVVRHYNEGWANGFHYGVKYWEIWNEPENGIDGYNMMWIGTKEQYYELYEVASKHLKACFGDSIKVGGYGATGFAGIFYDPELYGANWKKETPHEDPRRMATLQYRLDFLYGFFSYIKEKKCPIDFFSWHSYATVEKTVEMSKFLDRVLKEFGYEGLEIHINEWNNSKGREKVGKSISSAATARMMCAMQDTSTYMMCYYDARINTFGTYAGLFNPYTLKPVSTFYTLAAWGEMYALENQVVCDFDEKEIRVTAASKGEKKALLVVNDSEEEKEITLNLGDEFSVYLIDEDHLMAKASLSPSGFTLLPYQVAFIKNH